MNLILKYAIEIGASDIHITENQEGWVRAKGNLHKCGDKISLSDIDEFIELVIPGLLDDYIALRDKRRTNPIDLQHILHHTYLSIISIEVPFIFRVLDKGHI